MSFLATHIFHLYWKQLSIKIQRAIKVNYLLQCFYRPPNQEVARQLYLRMIFSKPITEIYRQVFVNQDDSQNSLNRAENLVDYFGFVDFEQEISSCDRFKTLNLSQLAIDDNMWHKVQKIVSKIKSLDTLVLRGNRLKDFRFDQLPPNLLIIDLRENPLQSVDIKQGSKKLHVLVDDRRVLPDGDFCDCMQIIFDAFTGLFNSR